MSPIRARLLITVATALFAVACDDEPEPSAAAPAPVEPKPDLSKLPVPGRATLDALTMRGSSVVLARVTSVKAEPVSGHDTAPGATLTAGTATFRVTEVLSGDVEKGADVESKYYCVRAQRGPPGGWKDCPKADAHFALVVRRAGDALRLLSVEQVDAKAPLWHEAAELARADAGEKDGEQRFAAALKGDDERLRRFAEQLLRDDPRDVAVPLLVAGVDALKVHDARLRAARTLNRWLTPFVAVEGVDPHNAAIVAAYFRGLLAEGAKPAHWARALLELLAPSELDPEDRQARARASVKRHVAAVKKPPKAEVLAALKPLAARDGKLEPLVELLR